jgi:hypothetical protein
MPMRKMDDPTSQKKVDSGAENQRSGMPMTNRLGAMGDANAKSDSTSERDAGEAGALPAGPRDGRTPCRATSV